MATCNDCLHYEVCKNMRTLMHSSLKAGAFTEGVESKCYIKCFKLTTDVVEVKHGYWKDRYGNKYDNHLYECSVCGKKALYELYSNELQQTKTRQVLSNACPHCLAKMDGRRDT